MVEFLGKLLLSFASGVIWPVLVELWKARRSAHAAPMSSPSGMAARTEIDTPSVAASAAISGDWFERHPFLGRAAVALLCAAYSTVCAVVIVGTWWGLHLWIDPSYGSFPTGPLVLVTIIMSVWMTRDILKQTY